MFLLPERKRVKPLFVPKRVKRKTAKVRANSKKIQIIKSIHFQKSSHGSRFNNEKTL